MRHVMNEAFSVKLGHGQPNKPFDTLEAAVEYINAGMKKRDSNTYALYQDNKEMIWLDYYRDENDNGVGYTVARQDDKDSVEFDKQKGLLIKEPELEDAEDLRAVVVQETGRMKHYSEAAKLAKFKFVEDKSKPSYIDFAKNCVHYNTNEQLNATIEELVKQLKSKKESLDGEPLEELFGFGKKPRKVRYCIGIKTGNAGNVDVDKLAKAIEKRVRRYADNVKVYNGINATRAHNYFASNTYCDFEFFCTESDYDLIRSSINAISPAEVVAYRCERPRIEEIKQLIKLSGVSQQESIEYSAENWYKMNW